MATDESVEVTVDVGVDVTLVTLTFDPTEAGAPRLAGVLARYVVLTRNEPGCRNVDLCAAITTPGRMVVIEKWSTPAAQRAHFDGPAMVEMAQSCDGLLARAPQIELLDSVSAHDLA